MAIFYTELWITFVCPQSHNFFSSPQHIRPRINYWLVVNYREVLSGVCFLGLIAMLIEIVLCTVSLNRCFHSFFFVQWNNEVHPEKERARVSHQAVNCSTLWFTSTRQVSRQALHRLTVLSATRTRILTLLSGWANAALRLTFYYTNLYRLSRKSEITVTSLRKLHFPGCPLRCLHSLCNRWLFRLFNRTTIAADSRKELSKLQLRFSFDRRELQ